jgi:hypothetical protein
VYTAGFPFMGSDGGDAGGGDTFSVDDDAYDIGFDDEEEFEGEEA